MSGRAASVFVAAASWRSVSVTGSVEPVTDKTNGVDRIAAGPEMTVVIHGFLR